MIRFLAIDGFNLIRRIFEARHVQSAADMPSVVEAVTASAQRALSRHAPSHAALVLEEHDRTWRHLLYPEYKANRSATPPLLLAAIDDIAAALQGIGIAHCSIPSYEADDVIATFAQVVAQHDGQVVILSTDKIYLQLVSSNVTVHDHFADQRLDAAYVEDRYDIKLGQYVDYLSMVGDKSNNIGGVTGIGPKSAVELLRRYGSLDGVLAAQDESSQVLKVQRSKSDAIRARQLVTLNRDVELGLNLRSFRVTA